MSGIERIAAERKRQIEVEHWTPEHDDQHRDGELTMAAALYSVAPDRLFRREDGRDGSVMFLDPWPWWRGPAKAWDKRDKHDRLRRLEIAGALIAAEIDRLERMAGEAREATS